MSNNSHVSDPGLQAGHFYGDVRRLFNDSNIVLSEVNYKAGQRFPKHIHKLAHFSLLIKGEFEEYCAHQAYRYKPMTSMFHPPELEHWNRVK